MKIRLIFSLLFLAIIPLAVIVAADSSNVAVDIEQRDETLKQQAPNLNEKALVLALKAYDCARKKGVNGTGVFSVIDFSKPSNEKRLWIFDLKNNKLLYNTWVAHGIKSGGTYPKKFSNKRNSHSSSIGLYKTAQVYKGKHGYSLKLRGLEKGYNHNAFQRFVVVHGAWYVSDDFVKKYGRIGRSWGCPAVSQKLIDSIVNTIKDGTLLLIYYPHDKWLKESHFIKCD